MAEWSNATDLSSVLFGGAGSNPAGTIIGFHTAYVIFKQTLFEIRQQHSSVPLAQSVEHETLNLRVVGSSPTLGEFFFIWNSF